GSLPVVAHPDGSPRAKHADKLLQNFRAYFKRFSTDRRADGGGDPMRCDTLIAAHLPQRLDNHAGDYPAPAGMDRGDNPAVIAAQQHRHTIRHANGQHAVGVVSHQRIGLRVVVMGSTSAETDESAAMHLMEPGALA